MVSDYIEIQGLRFPTRRRTYVKNDDGSVNTDMTVVTIAAPHATRVAGRGGQNPFLV